MDPARSLARWRWAIAAVSIVLAACAAPEERPPEGQAELDATCRAYGFKPATDGYRKCQVTIEQAKQRAGGPGICVVTSGAVVCY